MKKSKKHRKKIFGHHLMLNLYGCNKKTIGSISKCYSYLDIIPSVMKTNKQSQPFIIYNAKIGFSGWVPIVESGISLYTNINSGFVSIDIYSCKEFDIKKIKDFTFKIFKPKNFQEKLCFRGREYKYPIRLLKKRGYYKII